MTMLYLKTSDGQHIAILEPENLEAVKNRQLIKSPNGAVLICYTPNAAWLGEDYRGPDTQPG